MGRRFRALLGIATTWGLAFSAFATTILVAGLAFAVFPISVFGPRQIIAVAIQNFLIGAIAGGLFAMLFARAERKRTIDTVAMRRVALWGFLGAAIPAALTALTAGAWFQLPVAVISVGTFVAGIMGSAMSMATIKLARRAPAIADGSGNDAHLLPRDDRRK